MGGIAEAAVKPWFLLDYAAPSAMPPYLALGVNSHSYKDLFEVSEKLDLPKVDALQAFRRTVFNVLALNKDDHVKNFGFQLITS